MHNSLASLNDCPPAVLDAAAETMRQFADHIAMQAESVRGDIAERRRSASCRRRLGFACERLIDAIDAGEDVDAATERLARTHDVRPMDMSHLKPVVARRRQQRRKLALERDVMRGYRAGLTDAEIAARISSRPHPKHVARVRRAILTEMETAL